MIANSTSSGPTLRFRLAGAFADSASEPGEGDVLCACSEEDGVCGNGLIEHDGDAAVDGCDETVSDRPGRIPSVSVLVSIK